MISADTNNTSYDNLYAKFSKQNYLSAKNYLTESYTKNKIQYYNDEKKLKNQKIKKGLITGSVAFVFTSAAILAFSSKSFNMAKMKNATKSIWDKITNFSINFTNLKDDAWDRFAEFLHEKTPFKFIKTIGDKFSDWYRSNVYKSLEKQFKKAKEQIEKAEGGKAVAEGLKDYKTMFKKLDEAIRKKATEDRISSLDNLTKGKNGKIKNFINNLISPIADTKIIDVAQNEANIIKIPENASENLKKAIEHYNKLQQESLIPKLRDINYGCAPTDIITVGAPIGAFGVAVAKSEDKEEKKSLLLNIGVPLIPTVIMPILGTKLPILNGMKGMLAGFAAGQLVTQSVKLIDKKIKEKENKIKA